MYMCMDTNACVHTCMHVCIHIFACMISMCRLHNTPVCEMCIYNHLYMPGMPGWFGLSRFAKGIFGSARTAGSAYNCTCFPFKWHENLDDLSYKLTIDTHFMYRKDYNIICQYTMNFKSTENGLIHSSQAQAHVIC